MQNKKEHDTLDSKKLDIWLTKSTRENCNG